MSERLRFSDFERMLADDATSDEVLAQYLKPAPLQALPLAPVITIDDAKVEPPSDRAFPGLSVKGISQRSNRRRLASYQTKIRGGWQGPKLMAEGDSWFHYPILLNDVIDNLSANHAVYAAAATGNPLENLVRGLSNLELLIEREKFQGLLLSVGGNDIAGRPLRSYLTAQPPVEKPAASYLSGSYDVFLRNTQGRLDSVFARLTGRFPDLKIFCHGYDWLLPKIGGLWLQPALAAQQIPSAVQSTVLRLMIDRYYDMLGTLADKYRQRIFIADCRGAVGETGGWFDELHPLNPGFARVAARFQAVIDEAFGISQPRSPRETGARISWYVSERRGADALTATFPIGSLVTIGRASGNTIVLDDGRVSRKHARLEIWAGEVALTDLNTINGSLVDGIHRSGTTSWHEGQKLEIGGYSLQVDFVREAAAQLSGVPGQPRVEIASTPQSNVDPARHAAPAPPPREYAGPQHGVAPQPHAPGSPAEAGPTAPKGSAPVPDENSLEGTHPGPSPSRILARILDDRRLDYPWLAAFAAAPIALAWWINALWTSSDGFVGYGTRLNWLLLVVTLPISAYAMRWMVRRVGPVVPQELPQPAPPVIGLIENDAGRAVAYAAFRQAMLARRNLVAAFLITLLVHAVDTAQIAGVYFSQASKLCPSSTGAAGSACAQELPPLGEMPRLRIALSKFCCELEKDWSVAYLSSDPGAPGKGATLALNVSAYSVQFASVFTGVLLAILILRHNLFFLGRIYQRRRVPRSEQHAYVHIDIDDKEKCFGFRAANDAFNAQVLMLAVSGVFVLTTRFANVGPAPDGSMAGLFPDAGQVLAIFVWLASLAIVSLPILVKLLPRIGQDAGKGPGSLFYYLREFLSDDAWASGADTPREEIDAIAAQFAENSFWPTGNNRAKQIYFLSFWVLFVALVPDPRAIAHGLPDWSMLAAWAIAGVLAWGATSALFRFLQAMLAYIDDRLVDLPARSMADGPSGRRRRIPIGVFISYRRDDSAAYTGRLYDSLSKYMDRDRVFIDLDNIPAGADFLETIRKAIDSAQAMVVVIGPQWIKIARGDGRARIQDPNDHVHQEIASALQRDIRVFPVLVGGATMPAPAELPDALKQLSVRNAVEISNSRWDHDVGRLIENLNRVPARKAAKA